MMWITYCIHDYAMHLRSRILLTYRRPPHIQYIQYTKNAVKHHILTYLHIFRIQSIVPVYIGVLILIDVAVAVEIWEVELWEVEVSRGVKVSPCCNRLFIT